MCTRMRVVASAGARCDVVMRAGTVSKFQNFKIPNSKNLYVDHIPIPTCVDLYEGSHTQNCAQTHTHTQTLRIRNAPFANPCKRTS